jgi:hypothetical protein
MTAYVDPMRPVHVRVGSRVYKQACHLMADSEEELERIREAIGLQRRWRHNDHYDILTEKYRQRAIAAGAMQITMREMVDVRRYWRRFVSRVEA